MYLFARLLLPGSRLAKKHTITCPLSESTFPTYKIFCDIDRSVSFLRGGKITKIAISYSPSGAQNRNKTDPSTRINFVHRFTKSGIPPNCQEEHYNVRQQQLQRAPTALKGHDRYDRLGSCAPRKPIS